MEKVLHGPSLLDEVPKVNMGRLLFDKLKSRPPLEVCLIDVSTNNTITCSQVLEESVRLAIWINQATKTRRDTVIALIAENSWKYILTVLAGYYTGIPVHLISPDLHYGEMKPLLEISKPSIVFCTSNQFQKVQQIKSQLEHIETIVIIDNIPNCCNIEDVLTLEQLLCDKSNNEKGFQPLDIDMNETVLILNSSGTTGVPKCVMTSNMNMWFVFALHSCRDNILLASATDGDSCLPAHVMLPCLRSLRACYKHFLEMVVIMDKFKGDIYLETIEKYDIDTLFLVPPVLQYLLKNVSQKITHLLRGKLVYTGGATVGKEIYNLAVERLGLKIKQIYGMTETQPAILGWFHDDKIPEGSIGKAVVGVQIKVVDPEMKQALSANQVGELCIKSLGIMKGYMNNEKQTKQTISKDGFLRSGDLGYYDQDGYIYILERLKEIIKFKGFQVSPAEIEDLLFKHPGVRDAAVTKMEDDYAGEVPVALVVKKEDANLTEADIIQYVEENISYNKRLHGGVRFVNEIPKTPSGKILRAKLRDLLSRV